MWYYYLIGVIVFLLDAILLLIPVSIANAQRSLRATVPASNGSRITRVTDVEYNPFIPINLYEIFAGLFMFVQTIFALTVSLMVANGYVIIDNRYDAVRTEGGSYLVFVALGYVAVVCLLSGVWTAVASGISGALLIGALFNRVRFLNDVTDTIDTNYVNYAWLIIPLFVVFVCKWFERIRVPLASSGIAVYGFTLAIMPSRVVWTDNFVLVWTTVILCVWQLIYTLAVFPMFVSCLYASYQRKGHIPDTLRLVAINQWGDRLPHGIQEEVPLRTDGAR